MIQYDISRTKTAMTALATSLASIKPYVWAMESLTLGPQPLGEGTWDPLGKLPKVEQDLSTVQSYCEMAQYLFIDVLSGFPRTIAQAVGAPGTSGILNDFASILTIINALPIGDEPTIQQRQTVDSALQDLQTQIGKLLQTVNEVSQAGLKFLDQLPGDIEALTTGDAALGPAISQMQQDYENAVIQYSGIGGGGILQTLEQIYSQALGGLQTIQSTVTAAITAEQPVASALSQFQGIFDTLNSDYVSAIQAVQTASGDSFSSGLMAFDVPNAQTYWQQASQYAQTCGF